MQEILVQSLGQEYPLNEGNENALQYSCLKNPMDRGAWGATVHGITESDMPEHVCHTSGHVTALCLCINLPVVALTPVTIIVC